MEHILTALALLLCGAIAPLFAGSERRANLAGTAFCVCASLFGLLPCVKALSGHADMGIYLPFSLPLASFNIELDGLSAFFILPVLIISPLASLYGSSYLKGCGAARAAANHFLLNGLVASMVLVLVARNAMLFILAWELMSVTSFFLVLFESERESSRRAAWIYFIASHLGAACIIVFFILFCGGAEKMDFAAGNPAGLKSLLFVMALAGFGAKAGLLPAHVWLPEAHPEAPSHVSAIMSALMIKIGIYGIFRTIVLLEGPDAWWAWTLVLIGAFSALFGILNGLLQSNIKRFLAYSSVENAGIIAMGIGIGLAGRCYNLPILQVCGFGGALLHVLNHSIFKSLLFLGAGALIHCSGTQEIDRLGGLQKRMPWTGAMFLVGSASACAIPPFNGFVSEFVIYFGSFASLVSESPGQVKTMALTLIFSLSVAGALALVAFCRAYGLAFLGEPRTNSAGSAHEAGMSMRLPMLALALLCAVSGLCCPYLLMYVISPLSTLVPDIEPAAQSLAAVFVSLQSISLVFTALCLAVAALLFIRLSLGPARKGVTWDCGYAAPAPRMQYSAVSFSQPLTTFFKAFLKENIEVLKPRSIFPGNGVLRREIYDIFRVHLFNPVFRAISSACMSLRRIQHGNLQIYILYIEITLFILLIWNLL